MKKLKSEKGVITLITLVTVLFMLSFLISSYVIVSNKVKTEKEMVSETKKIYEPTARMEEIYNSYFSNDDIIPIYTVEQLLSIGSGENISINGKIYTFGEDNTYVLKNSLEFDVDNWQNKLNNNDWVPIGNTDCKFEGNGHTITVTTLANQQKEYNKGNNYSGYIQNGLVLYLDGEFNTRLGHNANSEIWEDLSATGYDFTLYNAVINDKYLYFNGEADSYAMGGTNNVPQYVMAEIVFNSKSTATKVIIHDASILNNYNYRMVAFKNNSIVMGNTYSSSTVMSVPTTVNKIQAVSIALPSTGYLNGERADSVGTTINWSGTINYYLIAKRGGAATMYNFKGNIYCIRLYNRILTDEEVQMNHKIDSERFGIE